MICAIEDAGFEIRDSSLDLIASDTAVQNFLASLTEAQADAFLRCIAESQYGGLLAWVYGSGFPKSHNRHGDWEGWGTALKPAWEPICIARGPLAGTVAGNLAAHGVGALNIDGCRVFGADEAAERDGEPTQDQRYTDEGGTNFAAKPGRRYRVRRMTPGATLEKPGGNWRPDDGQIGRAHV